MTTLLKPSENATMRLSPSDLKSLLKAFWSGALKKVDKKGNRQRFPGSILRIHKSPTTGESLCDLVSHGQVAQVLAQLRNETSQCRGRAVVGLHHFMLRVWAGFEDPNTEENQQEYPIPATLRPNYLASAITRFQTDLAAAIKAGS